MPRYVFEPVVGFDVPQTSWNVPQTLWRARSTGAVGRCGYGKDAPLFGPNAPGLVSFCVIAALSP